MIPRVSASVRRGTPSYNLEIHGRFDGSGRSAGSGSRKNPVSSSGLMNLEYVWVPLETRRRRSSAAKIVRK